MSGNSCSCHFSVQLSVGEQHIPLPKGDSMRIRAGARLKAMGEIGHAVLQYSLIAQSSGLTSADSGHTDRRISALTSANAG